MKLSRFPILLALTCAALPVFAQGRSIDISAFATWVDPSGETELDDVSDLEEIEFDAEQGWGVAVNVFWSNRISTEFAASLVEPDFNVRVNDPQLPFVFSQGLEMMPITAVLQFHLLPESTFDPYIGVGGAYFIFDDIEDEDELDDIEFEKIDFDDDFGVVVNAGFGWRLTPGFGLYLDGKYVPLESAARAIFTEGPGEEANVEINPLMLSAGLSFRF